MSKETRQVYPDADALARAAGVKLLELARAAVAERGLFTLALAGGSTPRKLYAMLASDYAFREFPWAKTHFFFGDERHVPPNHLDSNYLMASTTLFAGNNVPATNIHRIRGEMPDSRMAAVDYDIDLHTIFTTALRFNNCPRFDAILLGMGPDGHTASLFPGSKALDETDRWVVSNWVEKFSTNRITFTFPVLNAARAVLLLVAGADKTDMVQKILVDKPQPPFPVQRVDPIDGLKIWLLDQAAAAKLPTRLT